MADIFISYSKQEPELTTALVKDLEACGYTTWWDTRIISGDEFPDIIHQELNQAKVVIVIWTPNSVQSRWVRAEAHIAAEQGKLIPLRSPDLTPAQLPFPHNTLHADLFDDRRKIFLALERLGVLPPGGITVFNEYQANFQNGVIISGNSSTSEESLRAELAALRQDLADMIISAENITNNLYPITAPRFDIHLVDEKCEILTNGDAVVKSAFRIHCAKDIAYFWRYWITADKDSPEVNILRTIDFQAEDLDTGRKLYTLPVIHEPRHKLFSIFFPEMHAGEEKNIGLSYFWPGYMNQLLQNGKVIFDWRYLSNDPTLPAKIVKRWLFRPGYKTVNCQLNGLKSKTGILIYEEKDGNQTWTYVDEKAKIDDAYYGVEFALQD